MLNKDKRSMILSMVLGDGCLHYIKNRGKLFGGLTIDHGLQQSDYQTWKAKIVGNIVGRNINLRTGHKGKSIQFNVCWKRLKAWRKFCYPNGKKSIKKILPFITLPEFAIAIWLMDDGYVEPSISKLADGSKKNYGARLRLFTESQPVEDHVEIIQWFVNNLDIKPTIKFTFEKKRNRTIPFLKFTQEDSLKLWGKIRVDVLKHKSMQYKFRYLEQVYQSKYLQRIPTEK